MAELLPFRCRAFFMISDMSIPPPPPPPLFAFVGGGTLPGFPGFIVEAFTALPSLGLVLGGRVCDEESVVAADRVGRGGGAACEDLWAGLDREGMGVVGRGGGEVGMSSKAASGRSS